MENTMNPIFPSNSKTSVKIRDLVQLAVLIAIQLILEFTNIGYIKTPGLEFTIMQVPVIIGAIVMGPTAGGILGGIFGLTSFWQCFGKSAFGVVLMGINPIGTFLTCVPTRILMGVCCGLLFKGFYHLDKSKSKPFAFCGASLIGAFLNTALFTGVLTIFFYRSDFIQNIAQGMPGQVNPITFIALFVGVQGLLEAILCTVAGAAIARALYKSLNHM